MSIGEVYVLVHKDKDKEHTKQQRLALDKIIYKLRKKMS